MLAGFHPTVASWFEHRFGTPTEPQAAGWPRIQAGEDTLIAAPTGSGKTLAAFLACLDSMIRQGEALPGETQVVYVSPLKALANDVRKNLLEPLAELRALGVPEIHTAVRTGDTTQADRQRMAKAPPHVLVTTPESLYVLLTSESGRRMLGTARTVIVDEIHAVARDKRGAHLTLSLERLEALCKSRPIRIGLSATQRPIEETARFLVGTRRVDADGRPRCSIVDVGKKRAYDLSIEVPGQELSAVASKEQRDEVCDRVAQLVREHRTTLVFVNTRRQVERIAHALGERLGEDQVCAHHGSLSRGMRLLAEEKLKRAEVKAVVATASLELGIDIGAVELVVQLDSPRSLAVALQRIGRAAHTRHGVPKARLFPLTRDQLVECGALVRGVRAGRLEETRIPPHPLDVLAQQIVAIAACEEISEDALFERVRGAWPYRSLSRADFDALIEMHVEGVAKRSGRLVGARLHRDGIARTVSGRRGSRLAAMTSGGAIPDTAQYQVVAEPEGVVIGQLDEDFAIESLAGDIFLLGNDSWRIRRVEAGRVRVENAHGAPPSVPFWNGEAPGRTAELSRVVSELRAEMDPMLEDRAAAAEWAARECALSPSAAEQLVSYLAAAKAVLGVLPTQDVLVAERFFDDSGGMQLVVHAPFGARQNRAFGLALRKSFCRTFDFELQAAATDDGVLLSLGPQHSFPLESIFDFVHPSRVDEVLTQAALQAPMFGVRWRWNATRSLALLRHTGGKKVPFNILRMRSDDLLAQVFPAQVACQDNAGVGPIEPVDHPLVNETLRDCLNEAMDSEGLRALLERIASRTVRLLARELPEPSPLAHEVLNSAPWAYLDDAPLEERRSRAVSLRRTLPEKDGDLGALDAAAIAEVTAQAWPEVRDARDLHDALCCFGLLPDAEVPATWRGWLEELAGAGRAVRRGEHWCAADRPVPDLIEVVRGWVSCIGPFTVSQLAKRLRLSVDEVELAALESEGVVLRGRFTAGATELEWCERTLLARIHRLTLGRLRREIEPVSTADLMRFFFRWQHVHAGAHVLGAPGLSEVLGQLQGFQAAAGAWEAEILPSRIAGFEPAMLDQLCLSGEIAWGRLSCAPIDPEVPRRRSAPTRLTPIALCRREDLPWLLDATRGPSDPVGGRGARLHALLEQRGALFFHELLRKSDLPAAELEAGLWDLVAAGLASSDGFAAVRFLIAPPGRPGAAHPLSAGGRWSLLRPQCEETAPVRTAFGEPPEWLPRLARQYLRRYGVVFRDLLAREPRCPPWRELARVYRRMEQRGELRGGRFAQAFSGEQFALPEALDALRTVRRTRPLGTERVTIGAADPLNLVGILTPGPRVAAHSGSRVGFVDGVPQLEPQLVSA
jgi:ATP-dependent helicase Lhr and Lhr-like helicase